MQIRCPFCQYRIVIKGAKAGGYRPACPRCEQAFVMVIAMIEGHRLVLTGETLEKLEPVRSPKSIGSLTQSPDRDAADEAMYESQFGMASPTGDHKSADTNDGQADDDLTAAVAREVGDRPDGDDQPTQTQNPSDALSEALEAELSDDAGEGEKAGASSAGRPPAAATDEQATQPQGGPPSPAQEGGGAASPIELDDDATLDQGAASPGPADAPDDANRTQPTQPRASSQTASRAGTQPTADRPAAAHTGAPAAAASGQLTGRLDGYEIVKPLGEGGMGAVYLARQLSLDRHVGLKTIKPQWAKNPTFLSRFTREAYAAAQLTHHNVVQIYDIGEDRDTHYFSMEYVEGQSLADMMRSTGALDVEEAAGYILQAARGLKYAHDHDMVHRDIKPANLMINDQGVVKVADLGLVKTAQQTRDDAASTAGAPNKNQGADSAATAPQAMGTPAYMAPEQSQDAAHVDGRADIYSLGCTFYALTTGKPMFEGSTAAELMSKHASEQVTPPEVIARRVPKSISAIIMKMVAKQPDERYANMSELISALEDFLGISAGPFTPREEHARALEDAVHAFNHSTRARGRRWLVYGFTLAMIGLFLFGAFTARPTVAASAVTIWLLAGVGYAVLTGITQRTFVFRKVRQLIFGSRPREWVSWGVAGALIVALVFLLNLHWIVLWSAVAGLALAAAVHFTLDPLVSRERRPHLDSVREMLKGMRLRGLEEDAVRRFVCKYSGKHWEEFYETLFGYEAKIEARRLWGSDEEGRPRKKFGTWRDGLIRWIDQKQEKREAEKQRKHLQKIEARRLKAEGKSEQQASEAAERVADQMVDRAAAYKQTGQWQDVTLEQPASAADADKTPSEKPTEGRASPITALLDLLLGGRARFIVGAVLLAAYALWVRQNELWAALRGSPGVQTLRYYLQQEARPLRIPMVPAPESLMSVLSTHGLGLAGLLLLVAAFHAGRRMTFTMLPAVVVLLAAPLAPLDALPELPILTVQEAVLAIGLALGLAGLYVGRRNKAV